MTNAILHADTHTEQKQEPVDAMFEAEGLVSEIRRLIVYSQSALDEEGRTNQIQKLEQWLESYRRGLSAAQKLSANGQTFLTETRERLTLALEEIQRLDDEGVGTDATPEQKQRVDDISKAIRRIDQMISLLSAASFQCKEIKEAEMESETTAS